MQSISLFNSLGRREEVFKPIQEGQAGIYTCGLTVYDRGHIGNFRSFIFADVLRRMLEATGYAVTQA
jgi:cysteinyl-tRNA synthetase